MAIRANQLVNFKGQPYVTQPELTQAVQSSIAIKPFQWTSQTGVTGGMTAGTGSEVNGVTIAANDRYIILDAVILNCFNKVTGIMYGDLYYLTGNNSGKTMVVFTDFDENSFGDVSGDDKSKFVGYGFVQNDGTPITVLEMTDLTQNN